MKTILSTVRVWVVVGVILGLQGCAVMPDSKYADIAYKSEEGCHFIKYKKSWMEDNVSKIKWSGACIDGLMSGKGKLEFYSKQKPTEITESYTGMMSKGTFDGFGKHVDGNKVNIGKFTDSVHSSTAQGRFLGRKFVNNQIKFDGLFNKNGNFLTGQIFFSDGYTTGSYDEKVANYNIDTGEGIVRGRRFPKAEFTTDCPNSTDSKLTPFQKQELEDTCLYGKKIVPSVPIGGYFEGKVYNSMAALMQAEAEFAKIKADRERTEAAASAEHQRVQAIADAERQRLQAIEDAERYRLQQIENVKQARYTQLRQPCVNARSEASSLTDPKLDELKAEAITLTGMAFIVALSKNKYEASELKRKLEESSTNLRRQESIFAQNKARARSAADATCERAEQAVNNQRNQDNQAEANERLAVEKNRQVAEYKRASLERAKTKTDDPKVFGGSARGG